MYDVITSIEFTCNFITITSSKITDKTVLPTSQLVDKYIQQTHAQTHNQYTLEMVDLFEVDRLGEKEGFQDVGNRSGDPLSHYMLYILRVTVAMVS